MNNLFYVFSAVCTVFLTGCGSGGGGSQADAVINPSPDNPAITNPVFDPGNPTPINVVYYKKARTEAPVSGWPTKTYTASGSCVVYNSNTYCWDDGIKTVTIPGAPSPFTYSYWEQTAPLSPCHGGCVADPLTNPTTISPNVETALTLTKINLVFSSGTPIQVSCTLNGSDLDCGDFSIDLTQVSL